MIQEEYIYFIGIGGIGMSGLARYFQAQGKQVAGYDKTSTALTQALEQEGISISYIDSVESIPSFFNKNATPQNTLIVYTPAIPKDSALLHCFTQLEYKIIKRAGLVGLISQDLYTIAIAGTHGKTTTSSIVTHIAKTAGQDPLALLGGIAANYNTNVLIPLQPTHLIIEADEYDRSFHTLYPDIAIITSLDPDHLDIYGTEEEVVKAFYQFASQIKEGGYLIIHKKVLDDYPQFKQLPCCIIPYGIGNSSIAGAHIESATPAGTYFDYCYQADIWDSMYLSYAGIHNVENATAAITANILMQVTEQDCRKAMASFKGIKRRLEFILEKENIVFVDDYAHHPTEIEALIGSVRKLYPDKKITGIFQPHLYSRTRDFADGFAASLSLLDSVILLDIYPARELPMQNITSEWLCEKIAIPNKIVTTKENLLEVLDTADLEVLLTIGAGDIDTTIQPIKNYLIKKYLFL